MLSEMAAGKWSLMSLPNWKMTMNLQDLTGLSWVPLEPLWLPSWNEVFFASCGEIFAVTLKRSRLDL
jgi:hypothetical protein